jgi:hypothetical protein
MASVDVPSLEREAWPQAASVVRKHVITPGRYLIASLSLPTGVARECRRATSRRDGRRRA